MWHAFYFLSMNALWGLSMRVCLPRAFCLVHTHLIPVYNAELLSIGRRHTVMETYSGLCGAFNFLVCFCDYIVCSVRFQNVIDSLHVWWEHIIFDTTMRRSSFQREAFCKSCSCSFLVKEGDQPYCGSYLNSVVVTGHLNSLKKSNESYLAHEIKSLTLYLNLKLWPALGDVLCNMLVVVCGPVLGAINREIYGHFETIVN